LHEKSPSKDSWSFQFYLGLAVLEQPLHCGTRQFSGSGHVKFAFDILSMGVDDVCADKESVSNGTAG
jgi:hypothetical protein